VKKTEVIFLDFPKVKADGPVQAEEGQKFKEV